MSLEIRAIHSLEEFTALWNKHAPPIFDNEHWTIRDAELHSEEELKIHAENAAHMGGTPYRINLAAYWNGEFVGWSWGRQMNRTEFYMVNSAVLAPFRRRGIYTALMKEMVKQASALGFPRIYSRHITTNNAVIIPKLKAGFVISSMELSENFGTLVHLLFLPNQKRREMLDLRAGMTRPKGYTDQTKHS